jgi:hypothetical protein
MLDQDIVNDAYNALGCSADFLAAIAQISSKKLSRFMSGIQPLPGPELEHLLGVIRELKGLAEDGAPYPVEFKRADVIRRLVEQRRSGRRWIPIQIGGIETEELALK